MALIPSAKSQGMGLFEGTYSTGNIGATPAATNIATQGFNGDSVSL